MFTMMGPSRVRPSGTYFPTKEERAADDLKSSDDLQIAGRRHRSDEFPRRTRHGRHGKEMDKRVRAEDDKEQAKQNAGNDRDNLHVSSLR